ncbi:Aminopeptidase 2 [Fusarium oxysporum f. sp. narcissi]|uniref:Aminopeptidase n=1 Tax=Fusarium oxysporum f. sp. narcissi TaxID=451672 RepID=A0A4Q2UZL0_FUSOX|nr:Aminopeptidase 2 [Fusarium oxysporum f. sp. narcissi]
MSSISQHQLGHALPRNVKPIEYRLSMNISIPKFAYHGKVDIKLQIIEDTTSITLNAAGNLTVNKSLIRLQAEDSDKIYELSTTHDAEAETLTVTLDETLSAGKRATLTLEFENKINDDPKGLHRSPFTNSKGQTEYIVTTQFEPTYARRAFPCFDEPALKAKFKVNLKTNNNLTCLSNTDGRQLNDKSFEFDQTPPMSTYLLAFVIGGLECHTNTSFRVPVRIWLTPDQNLAHASFAGQIVAQSLEYYEEELSCKYPLPKLDVVAVSNLEHGATESWGLIIAKNEYVLWDKEIHTPFMQATIIWVLYHETLHQWLGNLATWASWNDWWLKEGLVTLFTNQHCAQLFQQLNLSENFSAFRVAPDLRYGLPDWTHPVKVPVTSPHEFYQTITFDSYQRSQYILSVVQTHATRQKFRQGIRNIIGKYGSSTVCAHHLWEALEQLGCAKVGDVANFWAETGGYCVIEVTEDDTKGNIRVKQMPFHRNTDIRESRVIGPLFMTIETKNGVQSHLIQGVDNHEYQVDLLFYKLNVNNVAPYYTLYTEERLLELARQFGNGLIDTNGMLGLLAETTVLTTAGYQSSKTLLSLIKSLPRTDDSVMEMGNSCLQDLQKAWMFEPLDERNRLKSFEQDLKSTKMEQTTEAEDTLMLKRLKDGDHEAFGDRNRFEVFRNLLIDGEDAHYAIVLEECKGLQDKDDRHAAHRSLGYATEPEHIRRTLAYVLEELANGRTDYIRDVLEGQSLHSGGIRARWEWLQENCDFLLERLSHDKGLFGAIIRLSLECLTQSSDILCAEELARRKADDGFGEYFREGLAEAKCKHHWVERDRVVVKEWLQDQGYV